MNLGVRQTWVHIPEFPIYSYVALKKIYHFLSSNRRVRLPTCRAAMGTMSNASYYLLSPHPSQVRKAVIHL